MKPLGKHVLIKPQESKSLMSVPKVGKGQAEKGIVMSIGEDVETKGFKEGDTVAFRKYSPEEFKLATGELVYLIEEADLMAVYD